MRGVGKTTLGLIASTFLSRDLIDADRLFEQVFRCSLKDLVAAKGFAYFRERESALLEQLLTVHGEGKVIVLGGGVVEREENRRRLLEYASTRGPVIHVERDLDEVFAYLHNSNTKSTWTTLEEGYRAGKITAIPTRLCSAELTVSSQSGNAVLRGMKSAPTSLSSPFPLRHLLTPPSVSSEPRSRSNAFSPPSSGLPLLLFLPSASRTPRHALQHWSFSVMTQFCATPSSSKSPVAVSTLSRSESTPWPAFTRPSQIHLPPPPLLLSIFRLRPSVDLHLPLKSLETPIPSSSPSASELFVTIPLCPSSTLFAPSNKEDGLLGRDTTTSAWLSMASVSPATSSTSNSGSQMRRSKSLCRPGRGEAGL